ncbi:ribulokinase [compost metagenome]
MAGIYPNVEAAMLGMGSGFDKEYIPEESTVSYYESRFSKYKAMGAYIEETTKTERHTLQEA